MASFSLLRSVRSAVFGRIPPQPDLEFVADFLTFRTWPCEKTSHTGVSKVPPARIFTWPEPKALTVEKTEYWTPPQVNTGREIPADLLARELRDRLNTAVRRSLCENTTAIALSGGLDSASIWCLALQNCEGRTAALRPISLVFPGTKDDESDLIKAQLEYSGYSHTWVAIDGLSRSPHDDLDAVVPHLDSPWGRSIHQMVMIAERMRQDGLRVLLTGIGGDEWLDGSVSYIADLIAARRFARALIDGIRIRDASLPRSLLGRVHFLRVQRWKANRPSRENRQVKRPSWLSDELWPRPFRPGLDDELESEPSLARRDLLTRLSWHQGGYPMEQGEELAAALGIELRNPMMDRDIVDFSFSIPPRMFSCGLRSRHLLRMALYEELHPKIRDRTSKGSFEIHAQRDTRSLIDGPDVAAWRLVGLG